MNIYESIKEDQKKLAEMAAQEAPVQPERASEATTPRAALEEANTEVAASSAPLPRQQAEDAEEASVKGAAKDAAAWARLRREKAMAERKAAELEAQLRQPAPQPAQQSQQQHSKAMEADPEPSKATQHTQWLEWKQRQHEREFQELKAWRDGEVQQRQAQQVAHAADAAQDYLEQAEKTYSDINPDYMPAVTHARQKYAESLSLVFPNKTKQELDAIVREQIFGIAVHAVQMGLDPIEQLYGLALERFGWQGNKQQAQPRGKKPDLRVIENNKRRAASPLMGGGQGAAPFLTKEAVANMSLGEFSKLSAAQLAALERM